MKKQALYYSIRHNHFDASYFLNPPLPGPALLQMQWFWTLTPIQHQKEPAKHSSLLSRDVSEVLIGLSLPCAIFLMLHPLSQTLHLNLSSLLHFHFYFISAPTEPSAVSSSPVNTMGHKKGFSVDIGSFLFMLPLDGRSKRATSCSITFLLNSKMDT